VPILSYGCRSIECFERHLSEKSRKTDKGEVTSPSATSSGDALRAKNVINRFKRPEELHDCGEWMCKCCKSWVQGEHKCFLIPEEPKKPVKKFIFFDFEATQDTIAECTEGYGPVCETCKDDELTPGSKCYQCSRKTSFPLIIREILR